MNNRKSWGRRRHPRLRERDRSQLFGVLARQRHTLCGRQDIGSLLDLHTHCMEIRVFGLRFLFCFFVLGETYQHGRRWEPKRQREGCSVSTIAVELLSKGVLVDPEGRAAQRCK